MIKKAELQGNALVIDTTDGCGRSFMLSGFGPYKLEHWDEEKAVVSDNDYRYSYNEYGQVLNSERV